MQTETETKPKRTKKAKEEKRVTKWEEVIVDLTPAERTERTLTYIALKQRIEELEVEKAVSRDKFKTAIAEVEAEMSRIGAAATTGKEKRQIEVWEEFVFEQNAVNLRRCDTGVIVKIRACTPSERQASLKGVDTSPTKGNGAVDTKPETPEAKAEDRETAESLEEDDGTIYVSEPDGDPLAGTPLEDQGPHDINAQEMPSEAIEDAEVEAPKRARKGRRA